MTVFAFGPRWESPLTKDAMWARTPITQPCVECGDEIRDGDQGLYVADPDEQDPTLFAVPIHIECYTRLTQRQVEKDKEEFLANPPIEVLLAAIDQALRTPEYRADANLAFTALCERLGLRPQELLYERGWAKKYFT